MKLAVLIDADNISSSCAQEIFAIVERLGEPITRRAYGNVTAFTGTASWKEAVRQHALEARPQINNIDRKNTADFALVIDAMDFLASGRYDGFVIVSSDSDFTLLAQRLRNADCMVYGMGDQRALVSFRNACTQFFELDVQETPPPQPLPTPPPAPQPPPLPPPAPSAPSKPQMDFQAIVADLRKHKCKRESTLSNWLMKNLKKPEDETAKIIKAMKTRKYITIDDAGKVTWLDKK